MTGSMAKVLTLSLIVLILMMRAGPVRRQGASLTFAFPENSR